MRETVEGGHANLHILACYAWDTIRGGEKNALNGRIFGTPCLIVALISIQPGDIFRFTEKCGFTPYQWP